MNELPAIPQFGGLTPPSQNNDASSLGQDFLRLMLAQLRNQDPFQPLENQEFLGQMAQISTATGIESLQQNLASNTNALAENQALQAASLVGRDVLVPGQQVKFDGENSARMAVELPPGAQNASLTISDAAGETVARLPVSGTGERATVAWDGTDLQGNVVEPGTFSVEASYEFQGESVAAQPLVWSRIESVALDGGSGISLNLPGLGEHPLSQVIEIA